MFARLLTCFDVVRVKTGLPVISPLVYSHHEMFVPVYWDVKKRERFIDYVKRMYPIHEKEYKVRMKNKSHLLKMANFNQRMKKEKEEEEYQAFKMRNTKTHEPVLSKEQIRLLLP
jgi:hypothetical protein